ncbi:MAG: TetR/AcrR family transcriptional regulator [Hymenobacter sp.]|nr:TetR/AcrR family transcriptional regulator [Hymenobacter sp.]
MQNTQQNIVDAAILVFNENYSAPLEKVAERAAVTRRTLHRYFKGRDELLTSCEQEMRRSCNRAMAQALDSSDNPIKQLENMLYGCIDCGAKYSFFSKLHTRPEHHHSPQNADCAEYDAVYGRYRAVIARLHAQGITSPHITAEWVTMLFSGVISATISARTFGTEAGDKLKQFAWFSLSKGIGL